MSLLQDGSEIVLQSGGQRFASQFGDRDMCPVCAAANVRKETIGYLTKDGLFVELYDKYYCIECGTARRRVNHAVTDTTETTPPAEEERKVKAGK